MLCFQPDRGRQFLRLLLCSNECGYQRSLGAAVLWGMTPTISKRWQGKIRNAERSKEMLAAFPLPEIRNWSLSISEMSVSCYNKNTFFFSFAYVENQIPNLKWNLEVIFYSSINHHATWEKAYELGGMTYASAIISMYWRDDRQILNCPAVFGVWVGSEVKF